MIADLPDKPGNPRLSWRWARGRVAEGAPLLRVFGSIALSFVVNNLGHMRRAFAPRLPH